MTEYKHALNTIAALGGIGTEKLLSKRDGNKDKYDDRFINIIKKALQIAHTIEAQGLKPMPLEPDDELLKAGFMYKKVTEGASQIVPITLDQYKRLLNQYDFKPEEM